MIEITNESGSFTGGYRPVYMLLALLIYFFQGCTIISEEHIIGPVSTKLGGLHFDAYDQEEMGQPSFQFLHKSVISVEGDSTIIEWPPNSHSTHGPVGAVYSVYQFIDGKAHKIQHRDENNTVLRTTEFQYDVEDRLSGRTGSFRNGDSFTDIFTYSNKNIPSIIERKEVRNDSIKRLLMYYTDSGYYVGSFPYDPAFPFYDRDPANPNVINGITIYSNSLGNNSMDFQDVSISKNVLAFNKLVALEYDYTFWHGLGAFGEPSTGNVNSGIRARNGADIKPSHLEWGINEVLVIPKIVPMVPVLLALDLDTDFVIGLSEQQTIFVSERVTWDLRYINGYSEK